ncbi:MAG: high-affinity branched-chain amino acid ABC transporter permease LivM [Alphaproteobacteria bacterium]
MVAMDASEATPSRIWIALKDSAIAALIMLALAVPLIGIRILNAQEGLVLSTRWGWVAIWVTVVFLGRLGMHYWQGSQKISLVVQDVQSRISKKFQPSFRFIIPLGLGFAVIMPFTPLASLHTMDVAVLVVTYIMLGWGLNIVVGLAGLLDLGYVAFYAIGAYSYALIAQHYGWSFWECLPFAGIFAAFLGVILGFPVLRLRGDYLAIVTLGFGEIIRIILTNWTSVTGGPNGVPNVPRPLLFGLPFARTAPPGIETFHQFFNLDFDPLHRIIFFYYVIMAMALVTNFFTLRIRRLPIGRAWEALREDEIACRALGINPTNTKLTAFAIGAMFGGFAGAFFAARQGFVSPESFTFLESAVILAIVVLGGMGSQIGVVIAAIILIGGTEWFRELSEYRMVAFGAAMVLIMLWRPHGLLASRAPTIRLATKSKT